MANSPSSGPRAVRRFVLKNGLTVLVAVNRSSPVAEVLLHVNTGYCWEPDRYQGLSHVVEHNLMQASAKRPTRSDFSMGRRDLGAFYDAGTGYDFTEYLMMVEPRFLAEAMELLCDGFFRPEFREDTFRAEMGAILQESRRKEDLPKPMALEKLYEAAFRVGRRRRWRLGTAESLARLTPEDLRTYFRNRYGPGNIVLAVGGNVDPDRTVKAVRKVFGRVPAAPVVGRFEDPEPEQQGVRAVAIRKPVGGVYWNAGFHAPPFLHPGWFPVKVLATVLGRGRGSRLQRVVRAERGLVDSIEVFAPDHDEYGLLVIEVETDLERLPAAEECVLEELARVRRHGIAAEELDRARSVLESEFLRSLSDPRTQLDWLALYELRAGGYRNAARHLEQLFTVRRKRLRETADRVIHPRNLSICSVLPENTGLEDRQARTLEMIATRAEARVMIESAPSEPVEAVPSREPAPVVLGAVHRPGTPKRSTLGGGMTLITRPDRNLPLFSATVLFRGGRAVETPREAGVTAVLLEALLLGGGGKSAREIALTFESMGVVVNPLLQPDAFGFSFEGPARSFPKAMRFLGEVVSAPEFGREAVEGAKKTVLGRIRGSADNPRSWVMDAFEEMAFKGHAYGNPPLGAQSAVRRLKAADLARWHRKVLHRKGLVAAVGGDVAGKKAATVLADAFGGLPVGKPPAVKAWKAPKTKRTKAVSRPLRQTATAVGFGTVPGGHDDFEVLEVIAWMSRGDGGRFYDEIRARRGLAYVVHAWNLGRSRAGGFLGFTATSPGTADEAERLLLREFARFSTEPPGREELERTKRLTLGMRSLQLRTGAAALQSIASAEASGVPLRRWLDYEKRVRAVTAADVARVARTYFKPDRRVKVQMKGKES